jgi:hypothetical protein
MLTHSELKNLITELSLNKVTQFSLAGSLVTLKILHHGKHVHLSAPVYWGGNFIPLGVRDAIKKRPPFDERVIETFLTTDEEGFEVVLHYEGDAKSAQPEVFGALMDEFGFLVDHWKEWLDDKDKKDLIPVVVRR